MARDGSGTHSLPEADFVAGTTIVASVMNSQLQDISDELTNSVAKDGQSTMTGALKMGTQRITGVGNATARTDGAVVGQIQDASYIYGTTGGTANAQTLTPAPAITAYVAGMKFRALIGSGLTNTSAVTLQVSGIASPKNVKHIDGSALIGGELKDGAIAEFVYDGTNFVLLSVFAAAFELVETKTASASANLEFTFPSGFSEVHFFGYNILPAVQDEALRAQVSIAGSYQTTGSYENHTATFESGTLADSLTSTDTNIIISGPADDNGSLAIDFTANLFNPANTTVKKVLASRSTSIRSNATRQLVLNDGYWTGANSAIDKIKFIMSGGGNIASGVICARYRRVS